MGATVNGIQLRRADLELLVRVLEYPLSIDQREAFEGMQRDLTHEEPGRCAHGPAKYAKWCLSDKQRKWVTNVLHEHEPEYTNEWSAGTVPRGREVPTLAILNPANLPKKPPPRKPDPDDEPEEPGK